MLCSAALLLAQLAFHEARGEPLEGQLAVMQVAQNRAERDNKTICQVVTEKGQFAVGSIPTTAEQHETAKKFMNGSFVAPKWSLDKFYFFSGKTRPNWAKNCEKRGNHTFCRGK